MSEERQAPPRLVQSLGPAGDCLREVLAQQEQVLPPRFALLQQRRVRRVRWQRGLLLSTLALTLVAAQALRREEAQPSIRAELATSPHAPPPAVTGVSPGEPLQVARAPARDAGAKLDGLTAPQQPSAQRLVRSGEPAPPVDKEAKPSRESEAGGGAKACAQLARGGAAEQALGCYEKLTRGTGMSAELALFEQARLEGKVLRRPERALRTLNDYRRRFPNGSLRGEAMLAQIDWLLAAGDSAQALQVVDEALASGLLRERAAELERLRATLQAAASGR